MPTFATPLTIAQVSGPSTDPLTPRSLMLALAYIHQAAPRRHHRPQHLPQILAQNLHLVRTISVQRVNTHTFPLLRRTNGFSRRKGSCFNHKGFQDVGTVKGPCCQYRNTRPAIWELTVMCASVLSTDSRFRDFPHRRLKPAP